MGIRPLTKNKPQRILGMRQMISHLPELSIERKLFPARCGGCGAPLHGLKCEFCGLEHIAEPDLDDAVYIEVGVLSKDLKRLLESGQLSINEARKMVGLPQVEDVRFVDHYARRE